MSSKALTKIWTSTHRTCNSTTLYIYTVHPRTAPPPYAVHPPRTRRYMYAVHARTAPDMSSVVMSNF